MLESELITKHYRFPIGEHDRVVLGLDEYITRHPASSIAHKFKKHILGEPIVIYQVGSAVIHVRNEITIGGEDQNFTLVECTVPQKDLGAFALEFSEIIPKGIHQLNASGATA